MPFSLATGTLGRMWVTIFISDSVGNTWWRFQDKGSPWFCKSHPDQLGPSRQSEERVGVRGILFLSVASMSRPDGSPERGQGWRPAESSPTAKPHILHKPYISILLIVSFGFCFCFDLSSFVYHSEPIFFQRVSLSHTKWDVHQKMIIELGTREWYQEAHEVYLVLSLAS